MYHVYVASNPFDNTCLEHRKECKIMQKNQLHNTKIISSGYRRNDPDLGILCIAKNVIKVYRSQL